MTALFTATSAVCVTGLIVVDNPGYWSTFGKVTILGLIQIGGLGIVALASLLGLWITWRFGFRRVTGRMLDYIEFEDDYAIVKTTAPAETVGKPLVQTQVRKRYVVTVVGIKRPGAGFTYATPETIVAAKDILLVAGRRDDVEGVADLT